MRSCARRSDDELVSAYRAGDRNAVEVLWQRHASVCRAIISRVLGQPDDISDALADTRERVLRLLGGYRLGTSYHAWVRAVAYSRALDVARRNRRQPVPVSDIDADHWMRLGDQHIAMPAELRDDLHERGWQLRRLVYQLIPKLQAVVWMRAVGASYDDIAAVLGIPMGTVKSRLSSARRCLEELERDAGGAGEI